MMPQAFPAMRTTPLQRRYRSLPPGMCAAVVALSAIGTAAILFFTAGFTASFSPIMREIGGPPVRWDACRPIHYVVNVDEAPPGALADTQEAAARVSGASGIPFVYDGSTSEIPTYERAAYQPDRYGGDWAPVLVAWVPQNDNELKLDLPKLGVGIPTPVKNGEGQLVYVTGIVGLNAGFHTETGFAKTTSLGSVVLHEFGHLAGLGHVRSRDEIMNPTANLKSPTEWGPGDTLGLFLLGRATGCLDEPRPRPTLGDWNGVDFPGQPRA